MSKIESLTKDQEQKMFEVRDFWKEFIFSCKNQINKPAATAAIQWLYQFSKMDSPAVIFVDSPLGVQYAVSLLKELSKNNVWDNVGDNVWDNVGDNVRANVWANVGANVGDNVRANVRDNVWDNVGDNVWDNVGANVRDNVRANVRDNVWANVRDNVWDNVRDNVRDNVGANVWANVGDNVWDNVRANVRANVWANVGDNVWDNVGDNVWANVRANVRDNVGDNVWDNVRANVRDNVGDNVWDNVRDNVWDNVRANVRDNVGDNVWDNVRANVRDNYESFASYGSISDYGWLAWADYFTQIGAITVNEDFIKFRDMMLLGIYDMVQLQNVCVVSNMPTKIVRNAAERLHNPTGPAIEFADGYCQYYINGRALPSWIWEKAAVGEITKEMFLKEQNSEIKGGIYEVLGQKKMMDLLGAEEVDTRTITHRNGDLETVTLLKTIERFAEIDNQPFAWVKMVCPSTGSQYLQGVEPHHTDALEAIASLSPFKPSEYTFDMRS